MIPALNYVLKLHEELLDGYQEQVPYPGELFHYTSVEGLRGIIKDNELWASSAYFLNDSSEITYGYGVLKETIEKWLATYKTGELSYAVTMAQELLNFFGNHLLNKDLVTPIYLACFCEDGNLLSQWRAYGQPGGYCFAFNFILAAIDKSRSLKPEADHYTSRLVKVEYERPKQLESCKFILDSVLPYLDDPETIEVLRNVSPQGDFIQAYQKVLRLIADLLMEQAVRFKADVYGIEKEWRMIVRLREKQMAQIMTVVKYISDQHEVC